MKLTQRLVTSRQRKKFYTNSQNCYWNKTEQSLFLVKFIYQLWMWFNQEFDESKKKARKKKQTLLILRDTVTRTQHYINLHQPWTCKFGAFYIKSDQRSNYVPAAELEAYFIAVIKEISCIDTRVS